MVCYTVSDKHGLPCAIRREGDAVVPRKGANKKAFRNSVRRTPMVLLVVVGCALLGLDIGHETGFLVHDPGLTLFDDIAIVVMILFAIKGYLQGIGMTAFSLVGYVAGLVGAVFLSPVLAAFSMNRTGLDEAVSRRLEKVLPVLTDIPMKPPDALEHLKTASQWVSDSPAAMKLTAENPLLKQVLESTGKWLPDASLFDVPVADLNGWLSWSLLRLLSFFLIFWLIKLLFVLIGRLFTNLSDLSITLGTANRVAGMVLGLLAGMLVLQVVYATVIPFLGSLGWLHVPDSFSDSLFLSWTRKLIALAGK